MSNGLIFTLIPAVDEPVPTDLKQQEERLKHLPLTAAFGQLPMRVRIPGGMYETRAGAGPIAGPDLQGLLSLAAKTAIPTAGTALVAWLHGRSGRKVKVKIGEVEVEASTAKEAEELLKQAQAFKQATQPKQLYER